jgi:predicted aldo/keto reductase-like oxidoreductase
MLMVSDKTLDLVVEVFEKVKKQGKVRFLGISAHNPKVFRKVLNNYPQFSVILFPYLFLTQKFGDDSLLELAKEKDVGVIGIKPFAAGTTFGLKPQESQLQGRVDPRAHVLVKEMLQEKRVACVIPGVNAPEQLEENVKGSYERDKPATAEDKTVLRQCLENYRNHLAPEYRWLRHWEVV